MSIRKALQGGGGGILNNSDITWKGSEFSTEPAFATEKEGYVYLNVTLREDRRESDSVQSFFMGGVDRYAIGNGGKSLSMVDGTPFRFGKDTGGYKLLASLVESKPEIEAYISDVDSGEPLNLQGLNGARLHVTQERDEKATKANGQRVDRKTGRKFDRTNTVVTAVLALPAAKPATKGNGQAAAVSADIADEAVSTMFEAIKQNNGQIEQSMLQVAIYTAAGLNNPNKSAIYQYIKKNSPLPGFAVQPEGKKTFYRLAA